MGSARKTFRCKKYSFVIRNLVGMLQRPEEIQRSALSFKKNGKILRVGIMHLLRSAETLHKWLKASLRSVGIYTHFWGLPRKKTYVHTCQLPICSSFFSSLDFKHISVRIRSLRSTFKGEKEIRLSIFTELSQGSSWGFLLRSLEIERAGGIGEQAMCSCLILSSRYSD